MCLAISFKPLANTLSFSDTASRAAFIDLRVALTTFICSFESFRKSFFLFTNLKFSQHNMKQLLYPWCQRVFY
jgi:transposase